MSTLYLLFCHFYFIVHYIFKILSFQKIEINFILYLVLQEFPKFWVTCNLLNRFLLSGHQVTFYQSQLQPMSILNTYLSICAHFPCQIARNKTAWSHVNLHTQICQQQITFPKSCINFDTHQQFAQSLTCMKTRYFFFHLRIMYTTTFP